MRIRKEDIINDEEIKLIATASDALAHPARVELFRFIYKANLDRQTVCNKDLVESFEYSQATISQHMKKLVISELIQTQRKDSRTLYFVNLGMLGRYLNAVRKLNA